MAYRQRFVPSQLCEVVSIYHPRCRTLLALSMRVKHLLQDSRKLRIPGEENTYSYYLGFM